MPARSQAKRTSASTEMTPSLWWESGGAAMIVDQHTFADHVRSACGVLWQAELFEEVHSCAS